MAKIFRAIDNQLREFIEDQKVFFVATAPQNGRVNLSPKGMNTFRVLSPTTVAYLDLTGSGNETAAHVNENARITFMFVSFELRPMILRVYCKAGCIQRSSSAWNQYIGFFPELPGTRQIFVADVDLAQTSCGYGVPQYELSKERPLLRQWAMAKGECGLREYWMEFNTKSIDGIATRLAIDS